MSSQSGLANNNSYVNLHPYDRCDCHSCTQARLPQFERAMLQAQCARPILTKDSLTKYADRALEELRALKEALNAV